jgi:hypothetical protein
MRYITAGQQTQFKIKNILNKTSVVEGTLDRI